MLAMDFTSVRGPGEVRENHVTSHCRTSMKTAWLAGGQKNRNEAQARETKEELPSQNQSESVGE